MIKTILKRLCRTATLCVALMGSLCLAAEPVAKIGKTTYESLAEALAAVPADGSTTTVTLVANTEENVAIAAGQNVKLDLGTFTLNGKQAANTPTIKNLGTLSVVNGTVTRAGEGSQSYYIIENEGSITLNTTVTGSASSSLIRNNAETATMTISGGSYTQTGAFIVLKNDLGTVTVNGGAFTTASEKSVLNNWNTMTINGGTFTGQILNGAYDTDNNVLTINDGTFNSSKIRTYLGNGKTIAPTIITGGKFNQAIEFSSDGTATASQAQVSGGSFAAPVPAAVCAENFESAELADGRYGVMVKDAVATVNGVGYASLAEALAAVPKDGTETSFVLQADLTDPLVIPEGANVTLDLNGHDVTVSSAKPAITNNGTLKVVGDGKLSRSDMMGYVVDNAGTIEIAGGYYKKTAGTSQNALLHNTGSMTISGGSFYAKYKNDVSADNIYSQAGNNSAAVTVTGGDFLTVTTGLAKPTALITGGTFASAPNKDCLDTGFGCAKNSEGAYVVSSGYVARNNAGTEYYKTLAEAIEKSTTAISLVADVTGDFVYPSDKKKSQYLYLNGHQLDGNVINNSTVQLVVGESSVAKATSEHGLVTGTLTGNIFVTGGKFANDPVACVDKYVTKTDRVDDAYVVVAKTQDETNAALLADGIVAATGTDGSRQYFKSVQEAWDASTSTTYANVTLLNDVTDEDVQRARLKNCGLKINLNGHSFSGSILTDVDGTKKNVNIVGKGTAVLTNLEASSLLVNDNNYATDVSVKDGSADKVTVSGKGALTLEGGTYGTDVSKYVAEDFQAVKNDAGKFVVQRCPDVAMVGDVGYRSLADALAAVPADGTQTTVTLVADTEENVVIAAGQNVALDLGEFTLNGKQAANTPTIKNKGTLSVVNGMVTRTGEGSSNWYIIENEGAITLATTVTGSASSSLIRNNAASATMTIDDGTYTQTGAFVVLKNDLGTVTVNGGAFTTDPAKAVLNNWDTMTINGGTFTGQILNGAYDTDDNVLTINDGTFASEKIRTYTGNGKIVAPTVITGGTFNKAIAFTNEGTATASQAQVSGGSFAAPVPAEVCAENFEPTAVLADGRYGVKEKDPVVSVDGVGYHSLQAAMEAAHEGSEVKLLADIDLTDQVLVDKKVSLDLAGHTIAYKGTTTLASGVIGVKRGGALTIEDSTAAEDGTGGSGRIVAGTKAYAAVALTVKGEPSEGEIASVTVNGGTLSGYYYGIVGNGSRQGTAITVNGGTIQGTCPNDSEGIYQPQNGTLTINGGTIKGATAVYAKSGTISITGGTLIADGAKQDYAYHGSGANVTGDALVIDNCNYPGGAPVVSVTGGRFESANAEPIASYVGAKAGETKPAPVLGFLSGSDGTYPTFNKAFEDYDTLASYCASGFEPHDDGNKLFTIAPKAPICTVDGHEHWSLQNAINEAAATGGTVQLLQDVSQTERLVVPAGKPVVLNLDGKTLTSTAKTYAFGLQNGADFELTNGTLAAKDIGVYAFPGSTLTVVEDATVTSETFYGLFINGAKAEIKGTIKTTAKDGYGVVVWGEEDAPFDVTVSGTVHASGVDAPAIGGNGTDRNPANKLTIVEGADISADQDVAIFWPNEGTLTISGGTITSATNGIYMKAGSLNVTGGTISSTATEYKAPTAMTNGSNGQGAAIVIEENAKYGDFGTVSISGGTFESKVGHAVVTFGDGVPQGFVTGGAFSNKVQDEICDEGYEATELLEDGHYGVKPKETVCVIGEKEYWSVAVAIRDAQAGDTITLVKSLTEPGFTVPEGKDVVFATGEYTYTATSPITVEGHLAINDGATIDFTSEDAGAKLFTTDGSATKVDIAGGSFNVPLEDAWCDEAYEPTTLEGGRFGVKEKIPVCTINGKGYWSVEAALKAAGSFDTIVMIEDVTGDAPAVTLDRGHVTLDLNGHTISSVLVSGAGVTLVDSSKAKTGTVGGPDVEKAIVIESGKLTIESGRVIAQDKAVSIEQSAQGEFVSLEVKGGTFIADHVLYQENVNGNPSTALENITIDIKDGTFTGNVYAENNRAFIEGGTFDPAPEKKYSKDKIKAEIPSVTVTTELDIVNPYDFKISLREAFLYAQNDGHNALSEEGGYKITFNWEAIKAEAASRGVEATGIFDMSAEPFEATAELYDETTGRCKFLLLDGSLEAGEDGTMGEGDRMAIVRGLDFHTQDTTAPVRAVVIKEDPNQIIECVEEIEDPVVARLTTPETAPGAGTPAPFAEDGEDEEEDTGEAVCEMNGDLYTSLGEALADAPSDGTPVTITLVANAVRKSLKVPAGKNVTLDLAGYTLETTAAPVSVAQGATLTLANGRLASYGASTLVESAGALTLRDMTLDATAMPNVTALCAAYCGTVTVTGATRLVSAEGGAALSTVYGLDEAFDAGVTVLFDDGFTGSVTGPIAYRAADRVEGSSWTGSAKVEIRGEGRFDTTFDAALDSNIRIYSGTFAHPETVPVEFQAVPLDGLYWQIVRTVDGEETVQKFASLPEAYATVPGDGVNVRIVQLFDQTGRGLVIDGNKNVAIDFNGKTYTVAGDGINANFIIDGKRDTVEFVGGTLRTTAPGNLISNKGTLTIRDMNIDLRGSELNPEFRNIISTTYGLVTVTGDTVLGAPKEDAVLAVTAQRNDDWNYDDVKVVFDEHFTGKVVGQVRYGENIGTTTDNSWIDAAVIEVYGGKFDINLTDTSYVMNTSVENLRLHGGTFTERSEVGTRPIGDFAYTTVDIDWELRARYVHFDSCSFDMIGRDVKMLVDRCRFEGNSERRPDWIVESESSGYTSLQFLNSVIHQAKGAFYVNAAETPANDDRHGGYILVGDSTIGELTGEAAIKATDESFLTYFANATFYGNKGKVVETPGPVRAVNVLSQKNGENLPAENLEVMTSIYQEEYADEDIFRMDTRADGTKAVHFGPRWLRAGYPVAEDQEGGWSLTPAYHLNEESVAGGNCRYIKLATDKDGYVEAITTALKQNGTYSVFAGEPSEDAILHTLHYDQLLTNLDRGQPSKGAFWIPVDEPSLVVTTIRDSVNPTDLEISLREAINYAKYLATEDKVTIPTITFDWDALDEEYEALKAKEMIGTGEGKISDYTMYLGKSIDWERRSNTGDCHLTTGKSAATPISITADELPQGLVINANRNGSVRPYFTVNGSLWTGDADVVFDLGDNTKLKTDHFQVTQVNGTAYKLGENANLYLTNSSAADHCTNGIVGDAGSTVVLERSSVACNEVVGVKASNVSAQNVAIGGTTAVLANKAQLFNTTVVGGVDADTVTGVNDIVSGTIKADSSWFRYSAFDSGYPIGDPDVTHNIATDSLQLYSQESSRLWHYRFPSALDWGRFGTAVANAAGYNWNVTGAPMPTYVWGQRTQTGEPLDVQTGRGAQALPDTWAAYEVGSDTPYSDEMKGAILNDVITNTRNPHKGQLSMGAWQANTIVAWKTIATDGLTTTDHATDFSRIDLNTYYSTLQDAVDALAQNASKGDKNVQFEGKDAVFLVSATLTDSALGDNSQTVISKGDVAIVGNSYYWSGIKSTKCDAALVVENDRSVAIANVGFVESTADAIQVHGSGNVTLYRSAINGNGGDGVNFTEGATGSLLMFNTTVANNKGTGVRMQSGTAEIYDSTIVGNNEGLAGSGAFYLANAIVLKNKEANEENVSVKGAYNVMSASNLTEEQLSYVFRDNSLTPWYRMVRIAYTGAAGWMGTKVGRDKDNNWYYLDRGDPEKDDKPVAEWTWKSVKTDAEIPGAPSEVITADQHGESRLLAEMAGFHEYAVGAYVPEMELEIEVMDQIYEYNGKAQNPDPNTAIYLIMTGIGKLNQGQRLYYSAADKMFYSEFAYVTNRTVDAVGVAPAAWGVPTVSNPRDDLNNAPAGSKFTFAADVLPLQTGDKINVIHQDVPGAKTHNGYAIDAQGYYYLDGYPFVVDDVVLKKGATDLTESYKVTFPQTENRDYAKMILTPRSVSLSRAFEQTKEYDGTKYVIITEESLQHAGVLFGEVAISPGSKFEYQDAEVLPGFEQYIEKKEDGTIVIKNDKNTQLTAEDLGLIGSASSMGNYYITSESQNYTSIIVPKQIKVTLDEIAKKVYDGEETTLTFDFTDPRLIYTATNTNKVETYTLAEALVVPTRYVTGTLTVCQESALPDVVTDRSQVFRKDVGEYPFYIVCDELHVWDEVETTDAEGHPKDFARNYNFDFKDCEAVFTVVKKPVTIPIVADSRVYDGTDVVHPETAVSHVPVATGVKDEAFVVVSVGVDNATYASAHVATGEAAQAISIADPVKVELTGENGALESNYDITFTASGAILKRPLYIASIDGVETKFYDGTTGVKVDTENLDSYKYIDPTDVTGLVGDETIKLTGQGHVVEIDVGTHKQEVVWDTLTMINGSGLATDYALQPFSQAKEDTDVVIEQRPILFTYSSVKVYDGTLAVYELDLAATTTNRAGKVTKLTVEKLGKGADGWQYRVHTGVINETTKVEELLMVTVPEASYTQRDVNTFKGDPKDVVVVPADKVLYGADETTGAKIANYVFTMPGKGTGDITVRPITFKCKDMSMQYGGQKPTLKREGTDWDNIALVDSTLGEGDTVKTLLCAFSTSIPKSRSGQYQKGTHVGAIIRGGLDIVNGEGVTVNRNYKVSFLNGTLQVGPGTLTMELDATPFVKDYDGTTDAEPNYDAITLKGLIRNNETGEMDEVTVTGTFTYDTKDVVYENETYTNKTITFVRTAIGGKDAANYNWATDKDGNVIVEVSAFGATIKPRPATVNVQVADKDYDSTAVATPAAFTFDNLVTDEAFTLAMGGVTASFETKNAGADKPVTVSLNAGLDTLITPVNDASLKSNYAFTFDPTTKAAIRGIPLTVTANPQAMTYGDTNPELTGEWTITWPTNPGASVAPSTDENGTWARTQVGDTVTVTLAYADDLETSSSRNYTAKKHEDAVVQQKTTVMSGEEDVTDSYAITYETADLTVAQRVLTVTVEGDDVKKVYDGTTAVVKEQENHKIQNNITAELAKNGATDEVDVTGVFAYDTKDVVFANETYANKTILFSNLELTGADADNYTLGTVTEVSDTGATITPFETTVTIAANDKTYDGKYVATGSVATFSPRVGNEQFTLDVSKITGTFNDRHAATNKAVSWNDYTDALITPVAGTGALMSNYTFVHNLDATATIAPKPATISFAAKDKVYDATVKAERTEAPFVFTGLVAPNEEGVTEAFTLNDASMRYAFSDKNVGEGKTVTASGYDVKYITSASEGGESIPSDYVFTFTTTAKANITKKPMTITYSTKDKVYDANTVATRDAFDYGELIKGDVLTLNDKTMTYAFEKKDVGEDIVVTATGFDQKLLEGADVKNYDVTFTKTSSAAITRRPVTVAFELVEKTYDGTVAYVEGGASKLLVPVVKNMADGESLVVQATGEFTDKVHKVADDYFRVDAFSFQIGDGQDLGNYTVTYAGDRVLELPSVTEEYAMPEAAGSFHTAGRINRKPLTISAKGQEMVYGNDNPELNTSKVASGDADWTDDGSLVDGDVVTVTLKYGDVKKSTSGHFVATEGGAPHAVAIVEDEITIVDGASRDVKDCYEITFVDGTLAVAKRPIDMTLEGPKFTKTYDGDRKALQSDHELVNTIEKDVVDVDATYTYSDRHVATEDKTVTASALKLTGVDAGNYKFKEESYVSTPGAVITERPTTIKLTAASKTYNGNTTTDPVQESFSEMDPVKNEDGKQERFTLDKSALSATFEQSDVGQNLTVTFGGYTDELVTAGDGTVKSDYTFTFVNTAKANITQRPSTIKWAAENKEYDAKVKAEVTPGSFTFDNLVAGEKFTMDEKGFAYTFDNKNVGTDKTVTATPEGTVESHISVADGAAAATKASNYKFTLMTTATAEITPAPLTITFTTKDKTYDATAKAERDAFTYTELLVDDHDVTDDVTLDDSAMEYEFITVGDVAGKDAAENKMVKTVEGKGYDMSYLRGVDKDNYTVTFTDASTATINKYKLRLDLPKAVKVYDATTDLVVGEARGEAASLTTTLTGPTPTGGVAETFAVVAKGQYKDTRANDYTTYLTVTDLTITGQDGAVFGNYVITYAGNGEAELKEDERTLTETGTYVNASFHETNPFGSDGAITTRDFVVAAIDQTVTYGDSYPTINSDGEHWGQGTVWSLPGTPLATGDRIWVTLKWNASIPKSSAGFYTAGTHEGALVVDKIAIQRTDGTDVTKSYQPTFQSATLTIKPRLLTVTVDGTKFSKVYDGNRTTEAEDRAYTVDEVVADAGTGKFAKDDVTVEGTYLYNDKDVEDASYVIFSEQKLTGTDAANYTLNDITSVNSSTGATITRRPCDITVTTTGKTYDGNVTANAIATYAFSNLVQKNESDVKEDFTLAIADFTGTFNSKDVETANTVTFTHTGDIKDHLKGKDTTSLLSNYDFTFKPEAEAKIAPLTVKVTWKAEDKNYDQNTVAKPTLGSFTFTTPVVNMNGTQESFTVSDENAKKMTYTFSDKNVGTDKTVTASGWTHDLVTEGADTLKSNYVFDFVPTATAEIKPIKLTIAYAANDKTYDATTTATRKGDFTYTGLIAGDVFALNDTEMRYDFDTKDVGTGKTVTAEGFDEKYLTGADVQNYDVEFTDTTTAAITKKELTLTLSEAKKVYDGTTAYSEMVSQVIPGTEGGEVFTATGEGVFTSKLVGSAADYFEVTQLDVAGTNGADFGNYKITYNGGLIDEALGTTYWLTTESFKSAGTITTAEVTVTALDRTMTYGDAEYPALDQNVSCEVTGLLPTDTLTATFTWKTFAESDYSSSHNLKAGSYEGAVLAGTVSIANGDENATESYVIKTVDGALTVNQKLVTVELVGSDFTKTYDGTTETEQKDYHFATDDVETGDVVTASGSFAYDEKDASETRVVTMSEIALGTTDDSVNYVLANADAKAVSDANAVIKQKTVAVKAQANDKVYDKTAAATSQTVTFDGLVAGETLAYPDTLNGTFANVNVGTGITVTWNDFDWTKVTTEAVKANYSYTLEDSSAAITPKEATVRAKAQEMEYAETRPSLAEADDWSAEGLEDGDTLAVTLSWNEEKIAKNATGREAVGTHLDAITIDCSPNANYTVKFVSASLTVKGGAKNLRIGWANDHLPIAVPAEWLERNLKDEFAQLASEDGYQIVSDGLLKKGANEYALWQSFLLGLDPQDKDAKLWTDADQGYGEDTVRAFYLLAARPAETGYAVHFRLDTRPLAGGEFVAGKTYKSDAVFDLALENGQAALACVFTTDKVASAEVTSEALLKGTGVEPEAIRSVNTIGVLKVESPNKNVILSVPWVTPSPIVGKDEPIAVDRFVKAGNLDAGDEIRLYDFDNRRYEGWTNTGTTWEPMTTVVADAESFTASLPATRGSGFWIVRKDLSKPVYLFGQVPTTSVKTEIQPGESATLGLGRANLVGNPNCTPFDFSTIVEGVGENDQIFVPQENGTLRLYTFKNKTWGYNVTTTVTLGGREVKRTTRVTTDCTIPCGQGFWYTSQGGAPVLTWGEVR